MLDGVRATCLRLYADGSIRGVLCLGGAEGALLGAAAMHALPVGVPEADRLPERLGPPLVRALRGRGGRDGDALGHRHPRAQRDRPRDLRQRCRGRWRGWCATRADRSATSASAASGSRCSGQTTPGVMRVREVLLEAGREPVIFHANGVGGPAMEHLIEAGRARRGDRLHAVRARQLAARRHPRHRARTGCAWPGGAGSRRSWCPAASTSSTRARATSCPSATATARPTSTTRWPRSCGSRATRRPSSAAWSPSG